MTAEIGRIIALGASNLTRGFHTFVSVARECWGTDVQIVAALGHGRSFGARSRVGFRTLPGILDSGLWRDLNGLPPMSTIAVITDVGNDILYGHSVEQILRWITETFDRIQKTTNDVTVAGLPLQTISRLSEREFLVFRLILFPASRLTFAQVLERAERLDAGIKELSAARGIRFMCADPAWYGLDPIHIRPSFRRLAWKTFMGAADAGTPQAVSFWHALRLHLKPPERRWLFGVEQYRPQSGRILLY